MKIEDGLKLQERLIDFAVRILALANSLPDNVATNHIRNQIIKSGTSPAANYGEARNGESKADFIHKLKIVIKELNETLIWLEIIVKSNLIKPEKLNDLIDENEQLCKIISKSIATAKKKSISVNK